MKSIFLAFVSLLLCSAMAVSFFACSNGSDGDDGASVVWKGSYASADDAALANPGYLWAYYNTTDGCSYVWDGSQWTLLSGTPQETFPVQVEELTAETIALRTLEGGDKVVDADSIVLGFMAEKEEIPYISLEDVLEILNDAYKPSEYVSSEVTKDTETVTITNTATKSSATIDLASRTCTFDNYDAFFQSSSPVYFDIATADNREDILEISNSSNISGLPIGLSWASQDIELCLWKNGDNYTLAIPLQTFNDVFFAPVGNGLTYNGKNIYMAGMLNNYKLLLEDFYNTSPWKDAGGTRSEALAEFCYNELCLNLDFNYGLKEIHGIDSFPDFDSYFYCVGIRDDLLSTDAATFASAVKDVCEFYFGDGHSNYLKNSPFLGSSVTITGNQIDMMANYWSQYERYTQARTEALGNNVPCYTVSADGKTAIVRFDSFTANELPIATMEEQAESFTDDIMNSYVAKYESDYDTLVMIHAVNEKIKKADSNIENVVLDLSCNGGGAIVTATYILSWLLGETTLNVTNPLTGAKWTATYDADVNFDGEFGTEDDTVQDKNLFCLVSPLSFSCGNFVPAVLKASDRVTILGVTSGGGTATVQSTSAADGTIFRVSSKYVLSVSKNGSNYNIDQGVDPHYYINTPANFYNTEKIAALVTSINKASLGSASAN